jgi:hypothetical protein
MAVTIQNRFPMAGKAAARSKTRAVARAAKTRSTRVGGAAIETKQPLLPHCPSSWDSGSYAIRDPAAHHRMSTSG